jgi:hypothetical protein
MANALSTAHQCRTTPRIKQKETSKQHVPAFLKSISTIRRDVAHEETSGARLTLSRKVARVPDDVISFLVWGDQRCFSRGSEHTPQERIRVLREDCRRTHEPAVAHHDSNIPHRPLNPRRGVHRRRPWARGRWQPPSCCTTQPARNFALALIAVLTIGISQTKGGAAAATDAAATTERLARLG